METSLIIHPTDKAQKKAIQLILDGFKVPYENEPSTDQTAYLLSTQANKNCLDAAMKAHENGEGVEIKFNDLWK